MHKHRVSEEYYFLCKGKLKFLVSDVLLTLQPNEILVVKPNVPHAVFGGDGEIEHFGIRAPAINDKQMVSRIALQRQVSFEDDRLISREWGYRIPLNRTQHQNRWLIGAGSAIFKSRHIIMAYLNFTNVESANAGIGTRHRLHLHQKSWEYYTVLEGTKILQIEGKLVIVEAGNILAIPPFVRHALYSRSAPFKGFTIRVPVELEDKIEMEN